MFSVFFLIVFSSYAQLTLNGDLYISPKGQVHVTVPKTVFISGITFADRGSGDQYGFMSFSENSITERADHNTHVNGFVRSYNRKDFVYPIGHDNIYQPVHFKSDNAGTILDFAYSHKAHHDLNTGNTLKKVSDEFYWSVKGNGSSKIYLSWSTFSNLDKLTDNLLENLVIAAYDGEEWKNIPAEIDEVSFQEGSIPNLLSGSMSSKEPIDPENFTAITLARKGSTGDSYDFEVSEAITPNGDGVNDTWFVENILNYPNSAVKVFNRLGQPVFETIGYQNDWRGNFKNNREVLPEGSYFFVIDLENDGTADKTGWIYITQ